MTIKESTFFNNSVAIDEPDVSQLLGNDLGLPDLSEMSFSNDVPLTMQSDLMALVNDIPVAFNPITEAMGYQPMSLEWASGETLYAGFDTEYQHNASTGQNEIISYQVIGQTQRGQCSVIVYPKSGAKASSLDV